MKSLIRHRPWLVASSVAIYTLVLLTASVAEVAGWQAAVVLWLLIAGVVGCFAVAWVGSRRGW